MKTRVMVVEDERIVALNLKAAPRQIGAMTSRQLATSGAIRRCKRSSGNRRMSS